MAELIYKLIENICNNCNQPILISIFKGTGFCCENCRKASVGEDKVPARA